MKLRVISPEKILFEGDVEKIIVPGTQGRFEVLENHAPIISSLEAGEIVFQPLKAQEQNMQISGGFVEVQKNEISLCVEL